MIPVYVNDIKQSLRNRCYFSALALALTLPDICGMAEFPNKSVGDRYTEWYDTYLGSYMSQGKNNLGGDNPWLSGEVIYNMRNTFLHQGSPNVIADKIKDPANQIDRFILVLGDGTKIWDSTINIDMGYGKLTFKAITVDVTYLCNNICDIALWYYKNNADKFEFKFNVITQDEFMNPSAEAVKFSEGDFIAKILNQKLESLGDTKRVVENHKYMETIKQDLDLIFSDEELKQRFLNGDSTFTFTHSAQSIVEAEKGASGEKREAQVRSFFGRHFKKKEYIDHKEEIIQAVLKSKTKQQINNKLMKFYPGETVREIYKKLQPLIKDLPGR